MKKLFCILCLCLIAVPCYAISQEDSYDLLISRGINPCSDSAFFVAVTQGDYGTAKLFVDAKQVDLNKRYSGIPYLAMSVYKKHPDIAMYLLENGADPNLKSIDGLSALFYAVKHDETKLVRKMLETPNMNIRRHRMLFRLPLTVTAKRHNNIEIYSMLVDYDRIYRENKKKKTL